MIDYSSFLSSDFSNKQNPTDRLVLVKDQWKNEVQWLSAKKVKNLKQSKTEVVHSLDALADIARSIPILKAGRTLDELKHFQKNLRWLNKKIDNHNKKIDSHFFWNAIDTLLNTLSLGRARLKYERLDSKLEVAGEEAKEVVKEQKEKAEIEKRQAEAKEKAEIEKRQAEAKEKAEIEKRKAKAKEKAALEKTKLFIRDNMSRIIQGTIGTPSKSRKTIRKIKADKDSIPHTFDYDTESGDILIHLGILGKGSYKVVQKQLSFLKMEMLAVGKQKISADTKKETEMMKLFQDNPYVVGFHKVEEYRSEKKQRSQEVITQRFYNMGDLKAHLKNLTDSQKHKVAHDILKGVDALHKKEVIHRDLKAENIFLETIINEKGEEEVRAVIGDLGLACQTDSTDKDKVVGSPRFMSLQALEKDPSEFSDDAWGVGMIFSELFKGDCPTSTAKNINQLKEQIRALENNPEPSDKNSIDYVIWKLLRPNVKERMTISEALSVVRRLMRS